MPLVGFEPSVPAVEQQEAYALDRAATGIDSSEVPARSQSLYRLRYPGHRHLDLWHE